MAKNTLITVEVETHSELSADEICHACDVTIDFINEMISHGTIAPLQGVSFQTWRFDANTIAMIRTATRLHHDLEINHAGIALILELMQELKFLRNHLSHFEK